MTLTAELLEHFRRPSPPYNPGRYPAPPPWPLGPDPRTAECQHTWTGYWGVKGERQRQCKHCDRFVWDSQIGPRAELDAAAET